MSLGLHKSSVFHPYANVVENMRTDSNSYRAHNFRKLFRSIERKDPSLWLAMCRLILIDFVCFPQYQLPRSCKKLQDDVERGRTLLTTKHNLYN